MINIMEKALRPNVLKDLVVSIVSVDEYKPKFDEENIVIRFQVNDNFDAAYDLCSFIEKSSTEPLDSEAVETPNLDGKYDVFVEYERNKELPEKMVTLLKEIENLTGRQKWKIQFYKLNDPIDFSAEAVYDNTDLTKDTDYTTDITIDEVVDFFKDGDFNIQHNEKTGILRFEDLNFNDDVVRVDPILVQEWVDDEELSVDDIGLSNVVGSNYIVMRCPLGYIIEGDGKFIIIN